MTEIHAYEDDGRGGCAARISRADAPFHSITCGYPENSPYHGDHPCRCVEGPYEGARLASLPRFCEQCHGLVDDVAAALSDEVHAHARAELEAWAAANPLETRADWGDPS